MNAKIGLDLYRVSLPNLSKTMIIGTDFANSKGKTYFGFSSTYTSALTQHYSVVRTHDLPKREAPGAPKKSQDEKATLIV